MLVNVVAVQRHAGRHVSWPRRETNDAPHGLSRATGTACPAVAELHHCIQRPLPVVGGPARWQEWVGPKPAKAMPGARRPREGRLAVKATIGFGT